MEATAICLRCGVIFTYIKVTRPRQFCDDCKPLTMREKQNRANKRYVESGGQAEWRSKNREHVRKYGRQYMRKIRKKRITDLIQHIGWGRKDRGWAPVPIELRKALIERANGKCEDHDVSCGGVLGIHHINKDHNDHRLENLRLLCKKHHNIGEHKMSELGGEATARKWG